MEAERKWQVVDHEVGSSRKTGTAESGVHVACESARKRFDGV
jgi:hypothetical protein